MHPAFIAASAWSATCSAFGAGLANIAFGCPACSPVLHCPAVSCHCGSHGAAVQTAGCPAVGCGWAAVLTSFGAGFAAALVLLGAFQLWRIQFWAAGGGDAAVQFRVGPAGPGAPGGLAPFPPAPAPPAAGRPWPQAAIAAAARPPLGAALGDLVPLVVAGALEAAVWRPRG
jgi:hypothetical protein